MRFRSLRDDRPAGLIANSEMTDAGWFLKEHRRKAGLTQQALADLVGTSVGYLSDLETGKRRHNSDWMARLARALGVSPSDLMRPPGAAESQRHTVPLVGFVGAGDAAHFYSSADEGLGEVEAPENATPTTVAAEVKGQSIGRYFDGWIVFYDEVRNPPTPDMAGELCVVGLEDGRVLVKWLQPTRHEGVFHLLSQAEDPLFDQEVQWAAKVTSMRPR